MRRYWIVRFDKNGFQGTMLVYGSERELWAYLNSEIGGGDERHTGDYSYTGCTAAEREMAQKLGIKAYLCPELN